jgi:hypothetical protein
MESTNTFSTRGNAKRNALKAGVSAEQVEIVPHGKGDDVRFGWRKAGTKPATTVARPKVPAKRAAPATRNGVKKPIKGVCADVWFALDRLRGSGEKDLTTAIRAIGERRGWNKNNVSIELSAYRRFHGVRTPRRRR